MELLTVLLLLLLAVLTLLFVYLTWNYNVFRIMGVPVVKPQFFFLGSTPAPHKLMYHEFDTEQTMKLGKVWGMYDGRTPNLFIADPEMVKRILVKDFDHFTNRRPFDFGKDEFSEFLDTTQDEKWKTLRSALSPVFTSGKLKTMYPLIQECVGNLVQNMKEARQDENTIDLKRHFSSLTMDVIAKCAFGTTIQSINDVNNPFVTNANILFSSFTSPLMILTGLFPYLMKVIEVFPAEPANFFKTVSRSIIKERRESGRKHGDFVDLLVELEENLDSPEFRKVGITEKTIVAQAILFLFTGFETTATTLTTLFYNLARTPHAQEKLRDEIDATLKEHDGELDHYDLQRLTYLDACINETLRLFPALIRLERVCNKEWSHGGITVPKGMVVQIPLWPLHHDADYFPEPSSFKPERFLTEKSEKMNLGYTHLPFGEGPRQCIGKRFAQEEMKLTIVQLMKNFAFSTCPETRMKLKAGSPFLIQYEPVIVKVQPRN